MDRLQKELVERRRLLSIEDQRSLMLAAAMIPAPKFLAFAAMVGYRIGGILGAIGSSNPEFHIYVVLGVHILRAGSPVSFRARPVRMIRHV